MIVGFIGAGNMAAGMARGWAAAEQKPERMIFTDAGSGRAAALAQQVGGQAVSSNREIAERADLVILAVKPKHMDQVAGELAEAKALLSILGGTGVEQLAEAFPRSPVMR